MTLVRSRRIVIYLSIAAALLAAFYFGGVAGFCAGFQSGNDLAQMSIGQQVVAARRHASSANDDLVLEKIVDDAIASYKTNRTLGPSIFDQVGVDKMDESVKQMAAMLSDYRRVHPRPIRKPDVAADLGTAGRPHERVSDAGSATGDEHSASPQPE